MASNKTKAPTGLGFTRDANKYTFSWKIGDADYGGGQQLNYRVNGKKWQKPSVSKTATSYSVTQTNVKTIEFRVRGNRKKYKKDNKEIDPTWSAWAGKTWKTQLPDKPSLSFSLASSNSGTFTWNAPVDNAGKKIFTNVQAQTAMSRNTANPPGSGWSAVTTKTASGSQTITEQSEAIAAGALVRWYRARSTGPAGETAWVYSHHAYGNPTVPTIKSAKAETVNATSSRITTEWSAAYNILRPIDKLTVQYIIAVPTDASFTAPASGWSDALDVTPNGGNDKVVITVADALSDDECMWVRIKAAHDSFSTYSRSLVAQYGKLQAPDIDATVNSTTGTASITITPHSSCNAAGTVIFYRSEKRPKYDQIVAVLPNGTTTASVTIAELKSVRTTCFGAYAFVGPSSGLSVSPKMKSSANLDTDVIIVAPASVTLSQGPRDDTVRIGWAWSWTDAIYAELAWSQYEDAWEATDEPSKYRIPEERAKSWIISGITPGTWYFRVRLIGEQDDEEIVGPWSATYSFDMSGVLNRPALMLGKSVIHSDETVNAKWAFTADEDVRQVYAEICLATVSGASITYGSVIAHVDSGQSTDISYEWTTGTTYYFAVRVTMTNGQQSEWSDLTALYVASPINIALAASSLTEVDGVLYLTEMPLTATITGAGTSGTTTLTIVRATDYRIYRPDELDYDGFENETIYTYSQIGEDQISVAVDDLIGHLDDGAWYTLIATVTDEFGQTASLETGFTVNWTHKADIPDVEIKVDPYQRISMITPIAPAGYALGDTCDIYRISADKPELIYQGAEFGTTYVDPYPAFGDFCGHRLVMISSNGDYVTASGGLAWRDTGIDDGDVLDDEALVIDVDGEQISLPYNIGLTNAWNKDFERTSYLGGSVQGDWNPAITRDMTADTILVRGDDLDRQLAMRDLAGFAGLAHIRTPDGSSLSADIQISERMDYATLKVSYTLTIKAVDPETPDGVTLAEWLQMHPAGG